MEKIKIAIFIIIALSGCKKNLTYDCSYLDSPSNVFQATINGSLFRATSMTIQTFQNFPDQTNPVTNIYAGIRDYGYFSICLVNSEPGIYYLGKLNTKMDTINFFTGTALFEFEYSDSPHEIFVTDSINNGMLTIKSKDKMHGLLCGTFSFTAKIATTDTMLIKAENGAFVGCYQE